MWNENGWSIPAGKINVMHSIGTTNEAIKDDIHRYITCSYVQINMVGEKVYQQDIPLKTCDKTLT